MISVADAQNRVLRAVGTVTPSEIIPLLNDYAEAVITAVHEAGGDVLKLIGDGTLALFRGDDLADACRRALAAHSPPESGV